MKLTQTAFTLIFLLGVFVESVWAQDFCPRLEGTNLECLSTNPTGPPPTGVVCEPSETSIQCYTCSSTSQVTRASYSDQCNSWTCQIETSPEGLPRKSAQCTSRSVCCTEVTSSCCDSVDTATGTRSVLPDCSVQIQCPNGGSTYRPDMCSGGSGGSCAGGNSCGSEAPAPSDCN